MVVALVITAAVATVGASAFSQVVDRRTQVIAAAERTEQAGALRATLREWIGIGAVELPSTTRQLMAMSTERGAAATGDEVVFTTNALTPAGIPGVRTRLFVDDDPATAERGLTIEYRPRPSTGYVRRELDPGIRRMSVEYLDGDRGRWSPATDTDLVRPIAVRLSFPATEGSEARLRELPLTFLIGPPGTLVPAALRREFGQ
jgi:hypothetical protein